MVAGPGMDPLVSSRGYIFNLAFSGQTARLSLSTPAPSSDSFYLSFIVFLSFKPEAPKLT